MNTNDHNPGAACDLCGLPVRSGAFAARFGERTYHYCCAGCRMVFAMLMEAADASDPSRFKETDLFRRCREAGVVPGGAPRDAGAPSEPAEEEIAEEVPPTGEPHALSLDDRVQGMWCPACAWVIAAALQRLAGVHSAQCDFSTDRLCCRYDPVRIAPEQIRKAVARLGYAAAPADQTAGAAATRDFIRLGVSALLSMNVMMLSWAIYSGFFMTLGKEGVFAIAWPIMLMATAVMLYGGAPIARKAWAGLRHGAPGMEVLVMLGSAAAYLYSLANFRLGSLHLYFDTASMLITLLLLGKMLEAQAKRRVRRDLEGFLALQPTKVRICRPEFPQGRYAALGQLCPGDLFRSGPEEVLPADGTVLEGGARLDLSAITGEPRPVTVQPGAAVASGSRIVQGELTIRAEQTGEQSLLGQMIAVVRQTLLQRTALETRTDRWLSFFVPLIAAAALLTGLSGYLFFGLGVEQALERSVTVLVIACPCALGIAIPLARVAGIAGAGRRGMLVRDFDAFELAGRIDTVVFDKTGTLTHGEWSVERIEALEGRSQSEVLALAAGLEEHSDHAVARALLACAHRQAVVPARLEEVRIHPEGVSGRHGGRTLRIGSPEFALPQGRGLGGAAQEGWSEVVLSEEGRAVAVFYFGDSMRSSTAALVQALKARGLAVQLISGDRQRTTAAVAAAAGIDDAAGGLLPQHKAERIRALQKEGRRVAMIGDGVNDAPALAQADLGVAVHSGSGLARHTAAVTLMRDPAQLLDLFDWALQVDRKVRQNVRWAFAYNLVSLPVAAAGLLSPFIAVCAMLLSSLSVIGNTVLLVRKG